MRNRNRNKCAKILLIAKSALMKGAQCNKVTGGSGIIKRQQKLRPEMLSALSPLLHMFDNIFA